MAIHHLPAGGGPCVSYDGQTMHFKLTAEQSNGALTIIENEIAPGAGPPLHIHEREDESYFVLSGQFEFICGEDRVEGAAGTFVFAPRLIAHRYKNIGKEPGRLLFAYTPAGIERFFRELAGEPDLTPRRAAEIALRHGIAIAQPMT
jgi:quercetin dioxygenase-like cupin family protein